MAKKKNAYLLFVGEASGDYGNKIQEMISSSGMSDRIKIVGWTSQEDFRSYLSACDCAVQLRTLSRGETSAAVLDCLNYGIPTIVNAHGSMAALPPECVHMIPDVFEIADLADALDYLMGYPDHRQEIGTKAYTYIREVHNPRHCAELYAHSIEGFYASRSIENVLEVVHRKHRGSAGLSDILALAESLEDSARNGIGLKQIFVDISELVQRDAQTGIQRVTRSILNELLQKPPVGYRVEPVYATAHGPGYFYARRFTAEFLGCDQEILRDEPIATRSGDIFLGLDLQPQIVPFQEPFLKALKLKGVRIYFVVYDILPIALPSCFYPGAAESHSAWLRSVSNYTGLICISRAVADQVQKWTDNQKIEDCIDLKIGYFHLGANLQRTKLPVGGVKEYEAALKKIRASTSFLMVGTVEPRKCHSQVLGAFERLWGAGFEQCLVIVGKQGWMVEDLVDRLRSHPQLNKRLFWFENANDELLEAVYADASCLIAASLDEGFGLPLVEASVHHLPILARDIGIFREVAMENAVYFSGTDAASLEKAILEWQKKFSADKLPPADQIRPLNWTDSTNRLLDVILREDWYTRWKSDGVRRFDVGSHLFGSQVGLRENKGITSDGAAGYLFFGPYIRLDPGRYNIRVTGNLEKIGAGAYVDAAYKKGGNILKKVDIAESSDLAIVSSFQIHVREIIDDFEVRVWVDADTELTVDTVEIHISN